MRIIRPAALVVALVALIAFAQPKQHATAHATRPAAASVQLIPTAATVRTLAPELRLYVQAAQQRQAAVGAWYEGAARAIAARAVVAPVVVHRVVPIPHRSSPANRVTRIASQSSSWSPAGGAAASSIGACVRRIESSGDYGITNSVGASGAYQYMPSTWNTYATRAGYGAYANGRAASAPPAVQDAVFNYTIAAGGGSNWSGPDPCTGH